MAGIPNADTPQRRPPTTPRGAPKKTVGDSGAAIVPWANMGDLLDLFETVPELRWPNSIITYSKMRTDAQIHSLFAGVTLPIRRYDWRVDPNGARDEVVTRTATDLGLRINGVEDEIPVGRAEQRFNHDDHLRQALLALLFGHQYFEQFGNIDDDENLRWIMQGLAPRLPMSIAEINVGDDGELQHLRQWSNAQGSAGMTPPIPRSQLVAYVWEREGANWLGRSWLRPLYRHWLRKDRLLRVDAMKHERNGMGIPWIEAHPGATAEQMAALNALAAAYKVGEASGGSLPNGAKLHLQGVTGQLPDTIASIRYDDEQMAKAWLGMVNELGSTVHGSRALGETLNESFILGQESIAGWYADITTREVVWDLVDWNWGPDENAPRIIFHPHEDKTLAVEDLSKLVNAGVLTVDNDTEDFIRSFWNLPKRNHDQPGRESTRIAPIPGGDTSEPSESELTDTKVGVEEGAIHEAPQKVTARRKVKATAATRPAPVAAESGFFRRFRRRGAHVHASPVDSQSGSGQTVNQADWAGHRKPTVIEAAAGTDFAALQKTWETNTKALVAAFKNAQQAMVDDLLTQIETLVAQGNTSALATLNVTPAGSDIIADHLIEQARAAIQAARDEASSQGVTIPLTTTANVEVQLRDRANAVAQLLATSLATALGTKAFNLAGPQSSGTDVRSAVKSYYDGLSDTYLNDQLGGALTAAQNAGRGAAFASSPQDTPVRYYASEILDLRTCDPCNDIDGTEYASIEDAQQDYPTGGFGDCLGGTRCRGTIVSVYGEASSAMESSTMDES